MSLFMGLGQLLGVLAEARIGCLQVSLQCLDLFTQLWRKGDKLRNKLKEKTNNEE